jgi:hypothetical protein
MTYSSLLLLGHTSSHINSTTHLPFTQITIQLSNTQTTTHLSDMAEPLAMAPYGPAEQFTRAAYRPVAGCICEGLGGVSATVSQTDGDCKVCDKLLHLPAPSLHQLLKLSIENPSTDKYTASLSKLVEIKACHHKFHHSCLLT